MSQRRACIGALGSILAASGCGLSAGPGALPGSSSALSGDATAAKTFFMSGGNAAPVDFTGDLSGAPCSGKASFGGPHLITIRFFSDANGAVKPTKKDLWVVPVGLDGKCGQVGFSTTIVEDFKNPTGVVHFFTPYTESTYSVYWSSVPASAAKDQAHLVGDLCDANLGLPQFTYKHNGSKFTIDPVIIKGLYDFVDACNHHRPHAR